MKAYVCSTGIVFLLIVAAHGVRIGTEGVRLLSEPSFVLTSLLALALVAWACYLFCRLSRPEKGSD